MIRLFFLLFLLLPVLELQGCADGSSEAPPDNAAHPLNWIRTHPAEALAVAGFSECINCHDEGFRARGGC